MADQKTTVLTELTTLTSDDIFPIVDAPDGAASTKKISVSTLNSYFISKLATVTGINAKTVATTPLYTVPVGKKLVVTSVIIRNTALTVGSKTVNVWMTFEDYSDNNEYAINFVNNVYQISYQAGASPIEKKIYTEGQVFNVNVTIASDADVETWAVDVFGYVV